MSEKKKTKFQRRSVPIPSIDVVKQAKKDLKKKALFMRTLTSTVSVLLVVASVAILIASLFLPVAQVSGNSMEPSLKDEDILVLVKTRNFNTGDLVCFSYQNKLLIKRLIGSPGDYIVIDKEGNVSVNGVLLDEPYVSEKSLGECDLTFPYQVPEERYFVIGDHRSTSIDSRSSVIGCVTKDQIVGRVLFRVWPFNNLSILF